jgi:hypothetical protein
MRMNKRYLGILLFIVLISYSRYSEAQSVYDFSVTTLDGEQHTLNEYAGKK